MLCKNLILLIFLSVLKIGSTQLSVDNSEKEIGDTCNLTSNKFGICKDIMNCDSAKKLFQQKKYSEIIRCGFVGRKQIVCCPTASKGTIIETPKARPRNPKFVKALCSGVAVTQVKVQNHIIDGIEAEVGEFPYQVALGYKTSLESEEIDYKCGGSLISNEYVLTAAHCANRKELTPTVVRLGRTSLDLNNPDDESEVEDIEIQTIKLHDQYRSKKERQNDIALIKLKRPVTYSDTIQPVCLSTNPNVGKRNFTISGFGVANFSSNERSKWLLKGTVHEYNLDECKRIIEAQDKKLKIDNTQFCALNDKGVDACQGDSGGPMVYEENSRKELFGIISYGNGCGSKIPAVYTRVDKYHDWIDEQMTILDQKS